MTTQINYHINKPHTFSSSAQVFNEGQHDEFHTLHIRPDEGNEIVIFFSNHQEMANALNDLRVTCESKIWELVGVPEGEEPF